MNRQLILDICREEHINVRLLSRDWLLRLEKDGRVRYIFNNCSPLNPQSSGAVAADKFATFEALRAAEIPVIEHAILYPFDNHRDFAVGCNTEAYLTKYFNDHNHDIVLKPNRGFGGQGITHLTSVAQFPQALAEAFAHSDSASLCPFYHILHEYRIIMLDGEPRLVYSKERGAGDWRFNLQNGAVATEVTDVELRRRLITLAKQVVEAMDLRFCSVDLIELDPAFATPGPTLQVIEVNSTVATQHYCAQHPDQTTLIKAIYRDAVLKIFE